MSFYDPRHNPKAAEAQRRRANERYYRLKAANRCPRCGGARDSEYVDCAECHETARLKQITPGSTRNCGCCRRGRHNKVSCKIRKAAA